MIELAVAAALLAPPGPPPADRAAAAQAAAWLGEQPGGDAAGPEADAVVALAAAGRGGGAHLAALRRLAPTYARTAGAAAKVVLAVTAGGGNPRCFAGLDLVHTVQAAYADGVYGASLWDQALAVTALATAAEPVPAAALRTLRRARAAGGWGVGLHGGPDDADSTGLVLVALRAAGVPSTDASVRGGAGWLLSQRRAGSGWAGAAGSDTVANSTGLALRGLTAVGRSVPASAWASLRRLQAPDGSLAATAAAPGSRLLATVDALPALLHRGLPPGRRSAPARPCAGAP